MSLQRFKFRAECCPDLFEFLTEIRGNFTQMMVSQDPTTPDIEVTLTTGLSYQEVVQAMKQIEDGHVMVDTVDYEGVYTGRRTYGGVAEVIMFTAPEVT